MLPSVLSGLKVGTQTPITSRALHTALHRARTNVKMRYADVAVNLADPMFTGRYHGKVRHQDDLTQVLERAKGKGVERILITGTSLEDSRESLELARRYEDLHSTVGIHPTSTSSIPTDETAADRHFAALEGLIQNDIDASNGESSKRRIRAIGEIGLDYDRLHFAPRETQLRHLPRLLQLGRTHRLPFFLHSRTSESHKDLIRLLAEAGWGRAPGWDKEWVGGVVHSFTGTEEEVKDLVDLGLYIGINGCSLKTPENLAALKSIPLDRLMLETDAPWCSITTSHASHNHLPPAESDLYIPRVNKPDKWKAEHGVKGRQEPADIAIIAHVVASVRGESVEEVADAALRNACSLFWPEVARE